MAHESGYTLIRLPSGEMRRLLSNCLATVGQVSNLDHKNEKLGCTSVGHGGKAVKQIDFVKN